MVSTAMGTGKVVETNPLKGTVMVELNNQVVVELPLDEITIGDEKRQKQTKSNK
jgi:hypothetical protein